MRSGYVVIEMLTSLETILELMLVNTTTFLYGQILVLEYMVKEV